jgi:hypothetical protein
VVSLTRAFETCNKIASWSDCFLASLLVCICIIIIIIIIIYFGQYGVNVVVADDLLTFVDSKLAFARPDCTIAQVYKKEKKLRKSD